jgi:mRNA interferase RelE/StbE
VKYSVLILRRAQNELAALPLDTYEKLKNAISALAENPRPRGCKKLTGREGWRIRLGAYRVIYKIDEAEKLVTVLHVGHRRDVYR